MRLNAYLAKAGVAARRKADELIKSGRVTINGRPGRLNTVVSKGDKVLVDAKPVQLQPYRYILIHKPDRTVTTVFDPQGRRKIVDLLSISQRVVPVGRLDWNTTGLLLLTNDGELANRLTHPSFKLDKVYEANVEGVIDEAKLEKIRNGLVLEDGLTAPAKAEQTGPSSVRLTIHEGRKHQVKRMLALVGLKVLSLHRPAYGPLTLGRLKPGQWRDLTNQEIKQLKMVK